MLLSVAFHNLSYYSENVSFLQWNSKYRVHSVLLKTTIYYVILKVIIKEKGDS